MEQRIDTLRDRLNELLGRIGSGSWRLRDDLVDLACDRAVDRCIGTGGRIPIDRLEAYACVVLRNLVRKGPPRAALHAERTLDLAADFPVILPDASSTYRVLPPLPETLSPAERQAVQATLMSATQRQAAKQAGMTPRDLRVRVGRAVEKIRASLEERSSPPCTSLEGCGRLSLTSLHLDRRQIVTVHRLTLLELSTGVLLRFASAAGGAAVTCRFHVVRAGKPRLVAWNLRSRARGRCVVMDSRRYGESDAVPCRQPGFVDAHLGGATPYIAA